MNKTLVSILLCILAITSQIQSASADTIIMPDGEVIHGKIDHILSNFIEIRTEDGSKKIVRDVSLQKSRDIIEVGFFKKKKLIGEILYMNDGVLQFATSNATVRLNRLNVRNIIIAPQDFSDL